MSERRHATQPPERERQAPRWETFPRPVLPTPSTPLIDREHTVRELTGLLNEPAVRLVTLTGPGGIGKTRLALAVARELAGDAAFVPLARITDPAAIPIAILQALGPAPAGNEPAGSALDEAMRDRHLLLVLDSVEHLLGGTPALLDLLAAHPDLTMLATSRTRLGLSGERVMSIEPLDVPAPGHLPTLDELARSSGVRLFVTRAQAVNPAFELTERNAAAIADICQRLEGLPLAIELAAARSHVLSPQELARRLERQLELLTGGPRDAPQRHRTMREAIVWSHGLLSPDQQRLFRRLAVFEGGASLGAIAAIASWPGKAGDSSDVVDLVSALVDHSLVAPVDTAGDDEPRVEMAGAIRELALERLADSGEEAAIRDVHAATFLEMALEGETHMVGEVVPAWLDLLERDHANFRTALAWTLRDDGTPERIAVGGQLAGALWLFWYYHSHLAEGRSWLERALAIPGVPGLIRGRLLLGLGTILHFTGEPERAQGVLTDGLDLLRAAGDLSGVAYALTGLGNIAEDIGRYEGAAQAFTEANALFARLDDQVNVAITRYHLGVVAVGEGDLSLAAARLEGALALSRRTGDPWSTAASLSYLGLVGVRSGDVDSAAEALREALALYRALGTTERTIETIYRVAVLAVARGELASAVRMFAAGDALGAKLGLVEALPEREIYARARNGALRGLPAARHEEERAMGAALPLQAAVAEAERILDPTDRRLATASAAQAASFGLSPREREVLRLMVNGASNDEIADALHVSRRTAAQHVGSILAKLGASNRTAATTIALRRGLA